MSDAKNWVIGCLGLLFLGAIACICSIGTYNGYNWWNSQQAVSVSSGTPTTTPTATGTVTTTVATATPPADDSADSTTICRLDKIGTWSEIPGAGPQRIEVGSHGVTHQDFYPEVGVMSVSYIVNPIQPEETPAIWYGYGSAWFGTDDCTSFDWVADAASYAEARLDSGHSGLVVDLRGTSPQIVANVAGMSQSAIDALLTQHHAAQHSASTMTTLGCMVSGGCVSTPMTITPTTTVAPATGDGSAALPPMACQGAARQGNADGLTVTAGPTEVLSIEAHGQVTGYIIIPPGLSGSGYQGALWSYRDCVDVDAVVAEVSPRGAVFVLQDDGSLLEQ